MHLRKVAVDPAGYPVRDRYPFNLPALGSPLSLEFPSAVTFFVGENGTGKSTLLKAICLAAGIHIWRDEGWQRSSWNPHEERLCRHLTLTWTAGPVTGSWFGSDIFRHFAQSLDEWAAADPAMLTHFGGRSLVTLSHGQSILTFFRNRYRLRGLYLLDEPETALSPRSQRELAALLGEMGGAGHAQFIVATHSPLLLAAPGAAVLSFDQLPVGWVPWKETELYRTYRRFFLEREAPPAPPPPRSPGQGDGTPPAQ
jgi:predicted ATPase